MSDVSARLDLPFIAPSQAQKHVTHNEAVQRLDLLVQMALDGFEATEPPAAPEVGARYALGQGAMGAWAGQDGQIALFLGEGWTFVAPQEGWIATARGTTDLRLYQSGTWHSFPERVARLGIATDADDVNRLSVTAEATLLNHAGAGHQLKINKATAGTTASLLFQTGFSGRAEMGIAGQDDFSIKVSANGTAWTEALRVNAVTGRLSGAAVQSGPTDTTAGRLMAVGAFGLGAATPTEITDFTAALSPGLYRVNNLSTVTGGPAGAPALQGTAIVNRGTGGRVGILLHVSANSSTSQQLWFGARTTTTGAIGWTEVLHKNNLLGTVSQSGGVPTGAVIERGSNANGRYVRFADGTQICTANLTSNGAADTVWTYPAAFVGVDGVAIAPAIGAARMANPATAGVGNTTLTFNVWTIAGARTENQTRVTATGRWF
jgi:hypothetical protein